MKSVRASILYAAVFVLIAGLYVTGRLDFIERRVDDVLFGLFQRDASGEVVFVDIDAASMEAVGTWPWPRRLHAALLDRLVEAGATQVAFNIDFSTRSNPDDDRLLAAAMARAGQTVVLPVFAQPYSPGSAEGLSYIEPIPEFRQHARIASANVRPSEDGRLRRDSAFERWTSGHIWTMAASLAGPHAADAGTFLVDFGIRPHTIPRVSFVDVLDGRIPASMLEGRRVVVGTSAIELGDYAPVPHWGYLPGPLFHAVAAESLIQGRALQRMAAPGILFGLLAVVLLLGPLARRASWRQGIVVFTAIAAGGVALTGVAHAYYCTMLDISPLLMAGALSLAANHVLQIDEQKLRILSQSFAIRRQDRFVRQVVDNLFDALITVGQDGTIHSYNPAAERLFGHRAENVVGEPVTQLFADAIINSTVDQANALEPFVGATTPREVMGRRDDGSAFAMELAVTEIAEETGPVYVMLARDISTRKAAERAALEAQRRLIEAIESMSEGFALFDADDRLVLSNTHYDELHGSGRTLMIPGTSYEDIVRGVAHMGVFPDAKDRPSAWIGARLRRRAAPGHPFEERLSGGRWCRITEYKTSDGGLAQLITDITDEKRREVALRQAKDEAELANRSKSMFLANMSHELRTPLNAIIGFSDIMRNQMVGPIGAPRYLEYSSDVFSSAQHLLGIINDILDISRIEAGKVTLEEEKIHLHDAVVAGLKLVKGRAEDGRVRMLHAITSDLPDLLGDERLIKQILSNLLSNAVRFTPAGGKVVVRAGQRTDGGLSLSVEDSGVGIAPEDLERIVKPFEQAETDHTRPFDGTGLGLPLVRHFAELHGGRFELESQVGRGTIATVHFPPDRTIESPGAKAG